MISKDASTKIVIHGSGARVGLYGLISENALFKSSPFPCTTSRKTICMVNCRIMKRMDLFSKILKFIHLYTYNLSCLPKLWSSLPLGYKVGLILIYSENTFRLLKLCILVLKKYCVHAWFIDDACTCSYLPKL